MRRPSLRPLWRAGCLLMALWWLAACHRTVPFDTKLAEEALLADKVGPARPPVPDSTGSVARSPTDTLTTARDTVNAPSIQTVKMKEEADKLAKDKAKSKAEMRALAKKAGNAAKKLQGKSFLGKRIKKGYVRSGGGKSAVIEKFHYLKVYEAPDPYAPAKYYYHKRKHRIFKASTVDPKVSLILHGPYEKRQNGQVLESGYFYIGTKHLRWERNALKDNILLSKAHWEKGFPRDARITYYDAGRKKVEEVIPYVNGKLEGDYVRFLPNGQLEWTGEFQSGRHVGVWTQYWGFRNRRHYQWQYPESEFEPETEPFLVREYNRNGSVIFEKGKVDKRAQNELEERRAGQRKPGKGKGKAVKTAVADQDGEGEEDDADEGAASTPAPTKAAKPAAQPRPKGGAKAASGKAATTTTPPPAATTTPATDSASAATPTGKPSAAEARERVRQSLSRPRAAPRKPSTQP